MPARAARVAARVVVTTARAAPWALAALVLAVPLALPAVARADDDDDGILCGVIDPLDPLLGCEEQPQPPPPPPPPPVGPVDSTPATSSVVGGAPSSAAPAPGTPSPGVTAARGLPPQTVPARPRYLANQLLVTFRKRASARQVAETLTRAGVVVEETIAELGVRVVRVSPSRRERALAQLRASRLVETAERDAFVYPLDTRPNDTAWPEQWGLQLMGLPAAWDLTKGSSTVVVAVVDTGVDAGHPDLAGVVLPGVDLISGDGDPADDHGHGTAVAGIIAARTNNGQGQAGACWACSILPIKVLDSSGAGTMSLAAQGIVEAVDRGARVINLSLGGPAGSEALESAVAYAATRGTILVAAAGNNATEAPFFPAAYAGVIAVAGTDDLDRLFSWSNFGPWVRLAAPGCNVATLVGDGYEHVCGTSMAAPLVAGVAALAIAGRPTASRADVENVLIASAVATEGGPKRVNAVAALTALGITPPAEAPTAPGLRRPVAMRGKLSPHGPSRAFPIAVVAGRLTATLTFSGGRPATLAVEGEDGVVLARVKGRSPLRLDHLAPAGALRLVVRSATRMTFTLRVSYPRASTGA